MAENDKAVVVAYMEHLLFCTVNLHVVQKRREESKQYEYKDLTTRNMYGFCNPLMTDLSLNAWQHMLRLITDEDIHKHP